MKNKSKFTIALTAIVLTMSVFFACQKKSASTDSNELDLNPILKEFVNSSEFQRSMNSFQDLGDIDTENSKSEKVSENGVKFDLIKVYFKKNNELTGFIEAIKMDSRAKNIIPNDDKYLMTLVKYENYDFQSKTGNIKLFDLNYDNFNYSNLSLKNGTFTSKVVSKLPSDIANKYTNLKKKKDLNNNSAAFQSRHYCDENGNGNVGYFECVGCFINACGTSHVCTGMCFLTAPYCGGSIAAACIYIAAAY